MPEAGEQQGQHPAEKAEPGASRAGGPAPRQDEGQHWDGGRVTNRLQIWEHESFPDIWVVCGKDDYLCGMGSREDMVKLAHVIIEKMDRPQDGQKETPAMNMAEGTEAQPKGQESQGYPAEPVRMLGNVNLMVYGSPRQPQATQALKSLMARSEKLTGTLFLAYPVGTDAVLISDREQVTVIDLHEGPPAGEYKDRQDTRFHVVSRLLRKNPNLMTGRTPKIEVQTISIGLGTFTTAGNPEHPLVNMGSATKKLEEFQQHPPQEVDAKTVIDQLLPGSVPR